MKKILLVLLACLSFNAFSAVNINTATQAELETLEGVGPVKAQAIIDYRKKNGSFKNIDELEKVDGIGAVTLANVRKDVTISGKTTVTAPAPSQKNTASKPEKSTKEKSVGTTKAAEIGKTAESKSVKEDKADKPKKESKAKEEKEKKEPKAKKEKAAKEDKADKATKEPKEKKAKKEKAD